MKKTGIDGVVFVLSALVICSLGGPIEANTGYRMKEVKASRDLLMGNRHSTCDVTATLQKKNAAGEWVAAAGESLQFSVTGDGRFGTYPSWYTSRTEMTDSNGKASVTITGISSYPSAPTDAVVTAKHAGPAAGSPPASGTCTVKIRRGDPRVEITQVSASARKAKIGGTWSEWTDFSLSAYIEAGAGGSTYRLVSANGYGETWALALGFTPTMRFPSPTPTASCPEWAGAWGCSARNPGHPSLLTRWTYGLCSVEDRYGRRADGKEDYGSYDYLP